MKNMTAKTLHVAVENVISFNFKNNIKRMKPHYRRMLKEP